MAAIYNQKLWRRVLNHVAADLLATIYKPSPAIADLDAIEDTIEEVITANAVANVATLTGTGATAGKIWIVTSIATYNNAGATDLIQIRKLIGATYYTINSRVTTALRHAVIYHGHLTLNSGEKIQAFFSGCAGATDNCRLYYTGYQIDKY